MVFGKFLSIIALTLGISVCAFAYGNYEDPAPREENLNTFRNFPAACHNIYRTKKAAVAACPVNVKVVEAFDFWSGRLLGWACKCEDLNRLDF